MPPRSEASAGVGQLVASIKQHKKFRQLASYSVQCLQKVITPPHVGWERNLKEAYEAGALDAITEVLQRHSGDSTVLTASTSCLGAMATNPAYAASLVESGALMSMLESVMKNPDATEGVKETLALLDTIATHNPEALLAGGGADAATRLILAAPGNSAVLAACTRTLEKLNKVPGGSEALIECDAVPVVMQLVQKVPAKGDNDMAETVESSFRLVERLCRNDQHAELLRTKYDAMQVLSTATENNRANSKLSKVGGHILSKLASGNVESLVLRMDSASTTGAEKEFLAGLLSNLALEEENAAKIVAAGGVGALLKSVSASSAKTAEVSARAISRLIVEENTDDLISKGAITTMVKALDTHRGDAVASAALTPTLTKLATSPERCTKLLHSGAIEAVVRTLIAHPEFESHSAEALGFFEQLGTSDFDLQKLVEMGVIPAAISAMQKFPKNTDLQLNGTRMLIYLSGTEASASTLGAAGAVPVALSNASLERPKELVSTALYLLTSLALVPSNKELVVKANGVDTILTAIATYSTEDLVQENAQELLSSVIGEAQVAASVEEFNVALAAALKTKSKADCRKVKDLGNRLVALCATPEFAELLVRADGVSCLSRTLEEVSSLAGLPEAEGIMTACCSALSSLTITASENGELRGILKSKGVVKSVVNAVKLHPKLTHSVTAGLNFLQSFAALPDMTDFVTEDGAVEACAAALRANTNNADIVTDALSTLLQLSESDKGAVAVAKLGGTRQVIATVHANAGTPNFLAPMQRSLALLQRVALTSEGAELLIKQGGVDAVIEASAVVSGTSRKQAAASRKRSESGASDGAPPPPRSAAAAAAAAADVTAASMAAASSRVLSRLMTVEDVLNTVEEINEISASVKRGRLPGADALRPILSRIAHMSTVSNFAGTIAAEGGATALTSVVRAILAKDDAALKDEMLPLAFRALASIGKIGQLPDAMAVAGLVSQAIGSKNALPECLGVITALASSSEAAAAKLLGDKTTLPMIVSLLKANLRNAELAPACFSALAALSSHDSTAAAIGATEAIKLVSTWIDDNAEDADVENVEIALTTLSNLARSGSHADAMVASGVIELAKNVLSKCCIESDAPASAVLSSSVTLLRRLMATASGSAAISASGALKRVVRAVSANSDYIKDAGVMESVMELMHVSSSTAAGQQELADIGAQDFIVAGMNANSSHASVMRAGAEALTALGLGEEAGRACVDDLRALSAIVSTDVNEAGVDQLGDAVQKLGNLVLIDGVVTSTSVSSILKTLSGAVSIMAESDLSSSNKLASAVNTIGRVVGLGGAAAAGESDAAVDMVMDVLSLNADNAEVREAAVNTLGTLSKSVRGLRAVFESGGIDVIASAAKSSRLGGVGLSSVQQLADSAIKNARELASSASGAATLGAVIVACADDPQRLADVLGSVVAVADGGGDDILFEVIASQSGSNAELATETLRVLREGVEHRSGASGKVVSIQATAKRMKGMVASLQGALQAQAALTATSDQRARLQALRMADHTLSMLANSKVDPAGATVFFAGDGVESLMQLLAANIEDEETVAKILASLKDVFQHATPAAAANMAKAANMGSIVGVLKLFADVPGIVADAIQVMAATARITGAEASGVDREGMLAISAAEAQYKGDPAIQGAVSALQSVMSAKFSEVEATIRVMSTTLQAAVAAVDSTSTVKELVSPDGRTYYYDSATGTTTWEAPDNYAHLKATMQSLSDAAAKQAEDSVAEVADTSISTMVAALQTHMQNGAIATSAAQALSTLAMNEANADAIAKAGGITVAIQAIQMNPDNIALLRLLLMLMERISRNDLYKEQIVVAGGVDVVVNIAIGRHVAQEDIALKSLSTLANLAFNSPTNIVAIMGKGGVKACEKTLQQWTMHARILENAMCALSNLMFGSDENKLQIGQTCGDEITNIIRDHAADVGLLKMALRALGNLSFCDENIRFVVEEHHATKAIVAGMRAHAKDEELLQLSMEVVGNFASLEEAPPEIDAEGNLVNPRDSISMLILKEAGCAELIGTIKRFPQNGALLKAALDALANIANDIEVTELMSKKQGLVPVVIELIKTHDWDAELVQHALPLLAAMSYSQDCVALIIQQDGLQVIFASMEQHSSNHELVLSAQMALTNMASSEDARTAIRNMEGVRTMMAGLESTINDKDVVEEAMRTFTRLCADDKLSSTIAETGMHIIMDAIARYTEDPEFLTAAFRLLGHLAFVESNITIIVQHNGIQKVVAAIIAHPDSQPLMVRSIQTLDNIAMANKENAAIVIDEGGKELLDTIMQTYPEDDEIQRYGKSALLSMSALENLSKSADITRRAAMSGAGKGAKKAEAAPKDPLAEFRHSLSAGKVMKVWVKGSNKPAHVVVSPDWKSIVWQDMKTQKKLGALDLRQVSAIKAGPSEGHKKALLTPKAADPECCFTVVADRASLELETGTSRECKTWVDALTKLLHVFRTTPQLL